MNQTWENGKKPSFGPNFGPFDPNLGRHGQTDGQMDWQTNKPRDGQTDRHVDKSDFIGCCPNNVELPLIIKFFTLLPEIILSSFYIRLTDKLLKTLNWVFDHSSSANTTKRSLQFCHLWTNLKVPDVMLDR